MASPESDELQMAVAHARADDLRQAFEYIIHQEARRVERWATDYLISFNVEAPHGQHLPAGSFHIEVSVRDAADGSFVPGLTVYATLIDAGGREFGTHQLPYLGHHWLYPYGRN